MVGCAGGRGKGSGQGGGSFAVVAYNATVDLTATNITGGNGGVGADGSNSPELPASLDAI